MSDGIRAKGNINFTDSAVAFGAHANASYTAAPAAPGVEDELRAELAKLAARLRSVSGELADRDLVTEAADEVDQELALPATGWQRILDALRRAGPAVASLARLATDVASIESAVQSMIPH